MQSLSKVSAVLSQFSCFAFCGFAGRRGFPVPSSVLSMVRLVLGRLPAGSPVGVGCCGGVPAVVRSVLGSRALVFSAGSFRPSALVSRSVRFVNWALSSRVLWVSFPVRPCPAGLGPSSSWVSCGSGSWSSLSLAVGGGCPALVFCPGWVGGGAWAGFSHLGGGWFFNNQ